MKSSGLPFHHPFAFWAGIVALTAGVLSHVPMFLHSAHDHYRMAGMEMDTMMMWGMALIPAGLLLAAYGLMPRLAALRGRQAASRPLHFHVADRAPLNRAHWGLVGVLVVAMIVDVMKPATLGFVIPGMKVEYAITSETAGLLALVALTGTTVGSLAWGRLADTLGRRAAILLSALMFMGTAICGAMPTFEWNLAMCFLMGMSAGGLLPIVFALLAETMPAKERGWVTVLVGGLGTVGGYLAASSAAALFEPHYGWRVLWLLNLPTGALVILLNRYIPESPRFLLMQGRSDEARDVMRTFGVVAEPDDSADRLDVSHHGDRVPMASPTRMPAGAYRNQTISLVFVGLAWGMVNWGFLTWLPSNLREGGLSAGLSNGILARSALMAIPGVLIVAWLYSRWSSKHTIVTSGVATAVVLCGFASGVRPAEHTVILTILVVGLLVASSGVIATLLPYSAEAYPTDVRGAGAGLIAASTKFAGIFGPLVIARIVTAWPGLTVVALVCAVPVAVASMLLLRTGSETRGLSLEEIHS